MEPPDSLAGGPTPIRKVVHASIVIAVSLVYLSSVFRVFDGLPWRSGLGDWIDPYFINALLEHWYRSVTNLSDPSSPAMYFPIRKTLGYSHGLVLYAPFYVPLRLFLHPFVAHTLTLFIVIEAGILCLYLVLRKLGLSFLESLLVSAFFFSSPNVINQMMGVWSQRASVFLIPPILLLLFVSARMHPGRVRLLLAGLGGFLLTLLYVQDFPTAHLGLLVAAFCGVAVLFVEGRPVQRIAALGKSLPRVFWLALTIVGLAGAWVYFASIRGGIDLQILGLRLRSHGWQRPAQIAFVALVALFLVNARRRAGPRRAGPRIPRVSPWLVALSIGVAAGVLVFLWFYLGVYREHRRFPEDQLVNSLLPRDPSRWHSPLDFLRDLAAYDAMRPFALVFVVGVLALIPASGVDRRTRSYCLWAFAISLVVLLIPLRFPQLSVWRLFFEWQPGFSVIRDPKRIISAYELAAALGVGLWMARLPPKSPWRISTALFALLLLVAERNRETFDFRRPIEIYERWVAAPIAVDPACRSFYIKGASEKYMSRSEHRWTLYSVDSMFVSMNHSLPTLNGYSAWFPADWDLHNPQEEDYPDHVRQWIEEHGLTGVCELDIDARTMTPRIP